MLIDTRLPFPNLGTRVRTTEMLANHAKLCTNKVAKISTHQRGAFGRR